MTIRPFNILCFIAAGALLLLTSNDLIAAPDAPSTPPRAFIQSILDNVTTILRNPKLNSSQRSQAVREIAYANID